MLTSDLSAWLPYFRNLEERVINAIEAAWPACIEPLQSTKDAMTNEDAITRQLVQSLQQTKPSLGLFIIHYSLLGQDGSGLVSEPSEVDFVLAIGNDADVYLACECKRLNVPYKTGVRVLSSEYVDEGLMRFVTGQYSNGLPLAMMLGYVMNGKTEKAKCGVKRAMARRSVALRLQSERDAPAVSDRPLRFHTTHNCMPGHVIEVTHTLLAWP